MGLSIVLTNVDPHFRRFPYIIVRLAFETGCLDNIHNHGVTTPWGIVGSLRRLAAFRHFMRQSIVRDAKEAGALLLPGLGGIAEWSGKTPRASIRNAHLVNEP